MKGREVTEKVFIPEEVLSNTIDLMRSRGVLRQEIVALWVGERGLRVKRVRGVWLPGQTVGGIGFVVSGDELFAMNMKLYRKGWKYIAQLHTHPGEAFHSEIDNEYPIITQEGSYSIVFPNFALDSKGLEKCRVYRLQTGIWILMSKEDIESTFLVEEDVS